MRLLATIVMTVLVISLLATVPAPARAQSQPSSIPLQQGTWPKAHLNVVIYPNSSLSWYSPALLTNASLAVRIWEDSISRFADTYPTYSYLRGLYLSVYVHGINDSGISPDISVRFDTVPSFYQSQGDTFYSWNADYSTYSAVIHLDQTVQSVITHEFGIALGLGEPSLTESGDLMDHFISVDYPSTLDLYALAYKYQWLQSGSYFHVPNSTVSLPSKITYAQVVRYQVQLSQAQLQFSSLTSEYDSLSSSAASLHSTILQLRFQSSSVNATLSSVRQQLASSKDNNTALVSQLNQESQALASLQSTLDQKSAEAQQLVYWKLSTIVLVAALGVTIVVTRRRVKSAPAG